MVALAALVLCAGCSPKPSDSDIAGVLTENVPKALKSVVTVEQTQADISGGNDGSLVKFKSHVKLSQPLFEAVDFDAVAKSTSSDVGLFDKIAESAKGLAPASQEELAAAIKKTTFKPIFLAQTAATGTMAEWYGSFKSVKVVDKWVSSDFKTEVDPALRGQPRSAFDETAIDATQGSAWFAQRKIEQADVLQKIETAKQLAQKDTEIEQAKASAQTERAAKEAVIAADMKQVRRLPVAVTTQRAILGNTLTLVMRPTQAMTVRLDVSRGAQTFTHDYVLSPGRAVAVGHLEGWGFLPGDAVRLSNPVFDSMQLTIR